MATEVALRCSFDVAKCNRGICNGYPSISLHYIEATLAWQDALASEVMDSLNRGEQNVLETRTQIFER
ncbi:MAG TPA: hypothetical protein VES38_11465, partial [Methylotenera sp.]|nr:hypothetical protein [Methylotenera sp.]